MLVSPTFRVKPLSILTLIFMAISGGRAFLRWWPAGSYKNTKKKSLLAEFFYRNMLQHSFAVTNSTFLHGVFQLNGRAEAALDRQGKSKACSVWPWFPLVSLKPWPDLRTFPWNHPVEINHQTESRHIFQLGRKNYVSMFEAATTATNNENRQPLQNIVIGCNYALPLQQSATFCNWVCRSAFTLDAMAAQLCQLGHIDPCRNHGHNHGPKPIRQAFQLAQDLDQTLQQVLRPDLLGQLTGTWILLGLGIWKRPVKGPTTFKGWEGKLLHRCRNVSRSQSCAVCKCFGTDFQHGLWQCHAFQGATPTKGFVSDLSHRAWNA